MHLIQNYGNCYCCGVRDKSLLLLIFVLLTIPPQSPCVPEAEYQIFQGFDLKSWTEAHSPSPSHDLEDDSGSFQITTEANHPTTPAHKRRHRTTISEFSTTTTTTSIESVTDVNASITIININDKFTCPEEERPSNIGPYEVPTQRDLVLHTQKTLHIMYGTYHEKAMLFLEDIMKATRATEEVEKKCQGNKQTYRQCVRHVSNKCEAITKSMTTTLELQRRDVEAFGKKEICTLNDMKEDPVKLIKLLASEAASVEFALPGFLRLLNACRVYCLSTVTGDKFKARKPSRHLTDTDIVIRHLLTRKHYTRLLPDDNKVKPKKFVNFKHYFPKV